MLRIGIDTGGTFTDAVMIDGAGRIVATHKRPSTPDDPGAAVVAAVEHLLRKRPDADVALVHGSTVATNALLEGTSEPPVFVTTAGFEHTLHLARQHRPGLYDLVPCRSEPPVPIDRCVGVHERLGSGGESIAALDADEIDRVVERVTKMNPPSVAISLLHSYANPDHEARVAMALRAALPDVPITVSSELRPVFREFERGATCVVNATVAPTMSRYLKRLASKVAPMPLRIMASHGGTMSVDAVCAEPVRTILSGPAGGAFAAQAWLDEQTPGLVTFDMGGTSTDVAVVHRATSDRASALPMTHESEAAGLPVAMPMIDLHTVGAGGGSIAWIDPGGALRVGPRSAGAQPGPACYGNGGNAPTVTDAHVVLGHLGPAPRLAGDRPVDEAAAHRVIESLGRSIGPSPGLIATETARGILRVVEATMAQAIKRVTLERGHDLRRLTLFPFGGAGGLHACTLADSLGIDRVLVPPHPGLLSAVGMLGAPAMWTREQAAHETLDDANVGDFASSELNQSLFAQVKGEIESGPQFASATAHNESTAITTHGELDLRYAGQSFEITVPWDQQAAHAFAVEHQQRYGHRHHRPIEIVTRRAIALQAPKTVPIFDEAFSDPSECHDAPTARVARDDLPNGRAFRGPLTITEYSAALRVPRGWRVQWGRGRSLLLTRETKEAVSP